MKLHDQSKTKNRLSRVRKRWEILSANQNGFV